MTTTFNNGKPSTVPTVNEKSIKDIYSEYFKDVSGISYMDVYLVCKVFVVEDSSGALQHAIKKLLLSGVRTGNKSKYKDIREARDTLNRWLEINKDE